MKLKNLVTIGLLLFLGACVVALIVKQFGPDRRSPDGTVRPISDGLIVYYFHGNDRCVTCRSIEAHSKEAVHASFADQLSAGRLQWLEIDYDLPQHEHFKADYGLTQPMVVLVQRDGGRDVESVNLEDVWLLALEGDKPALVQYVQREVRARLEDE